MILNYLKKITFVCGIILLSLSISGNSVFAAKGGKTQIPQLVIVEVYVDFTNETITINGDNFSNGDTPVITLGTQNLNVNIYSDTEIITELPIGIIDGDYLMTVITGPSSQNFDSYNLTVRVIEPNDQLIALCLLYQGISSEPFPLICKNCGNTITEPLEDCDDGNLDNGDGCNSQCQDEGDVCDITGNVAGPTSTRLDLWEGSTLVKVVETDLNGDFVIPNVTAGSTYEIIPSRNGYTFTSDPSDDPTITLDPLDCTGTPNNTGNDFTAIPT